MKKIFVITTVKNESDIIESFCRYNLTYCDGILVYENHQSSDNTREIIQKLVSEGLPVFFEDEEKMHNEVGKNMLAQLAVSKYGADLVIALDADEFLYHTDGLNPRDTLEAMREDVEYQSIWRTYIYEKEPEIELGFMPNNFAHYRNPAMEDPKKYERHKKVLASRYLLTDKQAALSYGTHFLIYPEIRQENIRTEICEKLVFAHFPIRSEAQVKTKAIINWINKWKHTQRPSREMLDFYQLGVLFNELKKKGSIEQSKLRLFSIDYAMLLDMSTDDEVFYTSKEDLEKLKSDLGEGLLLAGVMDTSFCGNKLALRYTDYNSDIAAFIRAMLEITDSTLTFLSCELDEKASLIDELTRKNDDLVQQAKNLEQSISDIYNSGTWKMGDRLRRMFRFFVPFRR
jgi:cell division protein FtsB